MISKEPCPLFLVTLEFSINPWKYRKFWRQRMLQQQMNLNLTNTIEIVVLKSPFANIERMKPDYQHIQNFKTSYELFWNLAPVSRIVNEYSFHFLRQIYCMCTCVVILVNYFTEMFNLDNVVETITIALHLFDFTYLEVFQNRRIFMDRD
jgi:hypothetical protein